MASKKEAKSLPITQSSEMPTAVMPTAEGSDTKKPSRLARLKGLSKRKKVGYLVVLILIVGVVYFFATGGFNRNTVQIGNNKVTNEEIAQLTKNLAAYEKVHPGVSFGKNLNQYASNKLILNAALKLEAKKHNITINDNDLATAIHETFPDQQSETQFFNRLRVSPENVIYLNAENVAYQTKLQNILILKENLTMVTLVLDSPYYDNLYGTKVQPAYNQAYDRMKNVFLPLVNKGASLQQLADKADIGYINPNQAAGITSAEDQREVSLYYSQGVVAVSQFKNYQKGISGFTDSDGNQWVHGNVGKIYNTNDKINQLTKVGQNTGVFASTAGAYMIVRLDSTNGGAYDSWATFLNYYKDKYAQGKLQLAATATTNGVVGLANKFINIVTTPGLTQAWAAYSCQADHVYDVQVISWDVSSGAAIGGARLTITVPNSGTFQDSEGNTISDAQECEQSGTQSLTSDDNAIDTNGYILEDGSNNYTNNCYGPSPSFSAAAPSGWTPYDQQDSSGNETNALWMEGSVDTLNSNLEAGNSYGFTVGYPDHGSVNHIVPGESNFQKYTIVLEYKPQKTVCTACTPCDAAYPCPTNNTPNSYVPAVSSTCGNGGGTLTIDNNLYNDGGSLGGNVANGEDSSINADDTNTQVDVSGATWTSGGATHNNTGVNATSNAGGGFSEYYDTVSYPYDQSYTWNFAQSVTSVSVSIYKQYYVQATSSTAGHWDNIPGWYPNTFTIPCPIPVHYPTGSIDGTQCINGMSGWAQDPDSPGSALEVEVYYTQGATTDSSGASPYSYGASEDGTYIANGARGDAENGHGFTIPIDPALLNGNQYSFFVVAVGVDTSGNPDGYNAALGDSVTNSNIMTACAPFTTTGSSAVTLNSYEDPSTYSTTSSAQTAYGSNVNTSFNPSISMGCSVIVAADSNVPGYSNSNYGSQDCSGGYTDTPTAISGPSGATLSIINAGDQYCPSMSLQYTGGVVDANGVVYNATGPNSISGTCATVVNKPYFKVYGNGAEAGGSFPSQPAPPGGGILASWDNWNNNNGLYPSYDYGGGSELANIASGNIVGYAGNQQSSQDIRPAPDLNFANTAPDNIANDTYTPDTGGHYGSLTGALPSESCDQTTVSPTPWPGGMPSSAPGNYSYTASGDTSLGTITIYPGQNVCLNVTRAGALNPGNVYIGGDITYAGATSTLPRPWTPSTVPSFILNVNGGNIYVSPGVGELDGMYAAQPNGGGGTIYTCGNSDYTAMSENVLFTGCNQQLTVYGAFEAQSVNLMRTYGTLRDETPIPAGTAPGPNKDTSVAFNRYWCGADPSSGETGIHFYQNSGNGEPAMRQNCSFEYVMGYILPDQAGSCDTPGAIPLWWAADPTDGNNGNFYTTDTTEPHTTVVGCVPSASATDTEPVYRLYDTQHGGHFYTNSQAEASGITANTSQYPNVIQEGAGSPVFYVYSSANDGGAPTTVAVNEHPPANLGSSCSNNGGRTSPRPTCAAEVFDYSPEASLSFPVTTGASTSANSAVGIYNLPPVL